jgi:hypothetical protein
VRLYWAEGRGYDLHAANTPHHRDSWLPRCVRAVDHPRLCGRPVTLVEHRDRGLPCATRRGLVSCARAVWVRGGMRIAGGRSGFAAKPRRPSVRVRVTRSFRYGEGYCLGLSGEDLMVGVRQFDQYLVRAGRHPC